MVCAVICTIDVEVSKGTGALAPLQPNHCGKKLRNQLLTSLPVEKRSPGHPTGLIWFCAGSCTVLYLLIPSLHTGSLHSFAVTNRSPILRAAQKSH